MTTDYKRRVMDDIIDKRLQNKGAVLLEGAKWCGKTTTCVKQQDKDLNSILRSVRKTIIDYPDQFPSLLMKGWTR